MRGPEIFNVTMTNANQEYSQELPARTMQVLIKCQDGTAMRVAFVTGKVAAPTAPYYTIVANGILEIRGLDSGEAFTIYVASAGVGKIVEWLYWVH